MCHTVALPFYIKKYLKAKEEWWKFKDFTMQKCNLQNKSSKRNQNPSRYHNSITNLKFQHKPKYRLSKNPHVKNRPIRLDSGHCLHQIQQHRKMSFGYILQNPILLGPNQTPHAHSFTYSGVMLYAKQWVVKSISSPAVLLSMWPCKNIFHIQV